MATPPEPPEPSLPPGLVPAPQPSPALRRRSDYRLVRTLLSLQHSRANGALRVDAEGVLTIIYVRDGRPVFVEGGLPADSLGRLLVQRGTISESILAQVEEQRMLMQGRLRFGDVARRMGVLDVEALHDALRDQVGNKLARCLHWEHSQHVFIPEDHGVRESDGQVLLEPLLLAGVRRHYAQPRIRGVLAPFWNDPAELRGDAEHIASLFALDEAGRATLAAIDGKTSVADILRTRSKDDVQPAAHLLVALALTDQLEAPEAIAPEESGPFKVDDLARRAPNLPRESDPAPADPARPVLREAPHLPGKEKLLSDSAFLQGKELLRAGEYGAAADAFREASNLRPSALEYTLFAAWSAYLSTGRAVKWRDMLVELCERTLAQDRHLAFAYHVRGQLALETRSFETARDALKRAVELDPQDDEARRLLARLAN
ncbi:MAG: DUF4388 domain-containing protein [Polyangiales bacterium]